MGDTIKKIEVSQDPSRLKRIENELILVNRCQEEGDFIGMYKGCCNVFMDICHKLNFEEEVKLKEIILNIGKKINLSHQSNTFQRSGSMVLSDEGDSTLPGMVFDLNIELRKILAER